VLSPTKEQALQLALMLQSGMPSEDAVTYFVTDATISPADIVAMHDRWMRSDTLKSAVLELQGKPWQDLGLEERIKLAIDKHYSEMAYFLYSRNYATLGGQEKAKADTCRTALEAKLAGMAGKMDALSRFWDDIAGGKLKLGAPVTPLLQ
jgi:hypothetical protein